MSVIGTEKEKIPTETEALNRLRFSSIIPWILAHEGGYVNDPQDPGGETNYGISRRSYPYVDIKNLTPDKAAEIYYNDWWKPLHLGEIDDDRLAAKIFDTCINCGKSGGAKILQAALAERGHTVPQDGYMHQQVIDACNKSNVDKLLISFMFCQLGHYMNITQNRPSNSVFLRGWYKRARSIYTKGE